MTDKRTEFQSKSSFWEADGFKKTVKRTEAGRLLSNVLIKLMKERAHIEKKYAEDIKGWAKKWNEIIDKSPAYGSTRKVMKGSLEEAEHLSEVHVNIRNHLLNTVIKEARQWKKNNYKKQLIGCREAKTFNEEFQKAQAPWTKKLEELNKARKDYRNNRRIAKIQQANAECKADETSDQIKKLQNKVESCQKKTEVCRLRGVHLLKELNSLEGKYEEDMKVAFDRTQLFDRQRIEFLKDILHQFADTLDQSKNHRMAEIYLEFHKTIDELDADSDLTWWSQNYGINMPKSRPEFIEFGGDVLADKENDKMKDDFIVPSKVELPTKMLSRDPCGLSNWEQRHEAAWNMATVHHMTNGTTTPELSLSEPTDSSQSGHVDDVDDVDNGDGEDQKNAETGSLSQPLISDGYSGVQVLATFDFIGENEDELSFQTGEIFSRIREADARGWCRGLKDGKEGFYPGSYAQPLEQEEMEDLENENTAPSDEFSVVTGWKEADGNEISAKSV